MSTYINVDQLFDQIGSFNCVRVKQVHIVSFVFEYYVSYILDNGMEVEIAQMKKGGYIISCGNITVSTSKNGVDVAFVNDLVDDLES